MPKDYSDNLRAAMAKIKIIMLKHSCGGFVTLHEPGHTEFLNHINPPYSGFHWVKDKFRTAIRLKGKKEHYGGSAEKRDKVVADSLNLLQNCKKVLKDQLDMIEFLEDQIAKAGLDWYPTGGSPDPNQN